MSSAVNISNAASTINFSSYSSRNTLADTCIGFVAEQVDLDPLVITQMVQAATVAVLKKVDETTYYDSGHVGIEIAISWLPFQWLLIVVSIPIEHDDPDGDDDLESQPPQPETAFQIQGETTYRVQSFLPLTRKKV